MTVEMPTHFASDGELEGPGRYSDTGDESEGEREMEWGIQCKTCSRRLSSEAALTAHLVACTAHTRRQQATHSLRYSTLGLLPKSVRKARDAELQRMVRKEKSRARWHQLSLTYLSRVPFSSTIGRALFQSHELPWRRQLELVRKYETHCYPIYEAVKSCYAFRGALAKLPVTHRPIRLMESRSIELPCTGREWSARLHRYAKKSPVLVRLPESEKKPKLVDVMVTVRPISVPLVLWFCPKADLGAVFPPFANPFRRPATKSGCPISKRSQFQPRLPLRKLEEKPGIFNAFPELLSQMKVEAEDANEEEGSASLQRSGITTPQMRKFIAQMKELEPVRLCEEEENSTDLVVAHKRRTLTPRKRRLNAPQDATPTKAKRISPRLARSIRVRRTGDVLRAPTDTSTPVRKLLTPIRLPPPSRHPDTKTPKPLGPKGAVGVSEERLRGGEDSPFKGPEELPTCSSHRSPFANTPSTRSGKPMKAVPPMLVRSPNSSPPPRPTPTSEIILTRSQRGLESGEEESKPPKASTLFKCHICGAEKLFTEEAWAEAEAHMEREHNGVKPVFIPTKNSSETDFSILIIEAYARDSAPLTRAVSASKKTPFNLM